MAGFVLAELTPAVARETAWQVAVLPFGATEPHNLHMPYGTDTLQVEEIGRRACADATAAGAAVALLPPRRGGGGRAAPGPAVRREHQPPEGSRRAGVQPDADDTARRHYRPGRRA